MFCTKCGNKLAEGAEFCGECGHKTNIESNKEDFKVNSIKVEKAKSIKTKNLKKFKIPKAKLGKLSIGLIAILILVFVLKDAVAYGVFPEKYIMSSINKTFKSANKNLKKTQSVFLGDISKKSSSNDLKLMIKKADSSQAWLAESFNLFNGMGLELKTAIDFKNKFVYVGGKAIYDGNDFVSLDVKLDDTELLVKVPELYHKAFTIPSKDLGIQWNQSTIAQEAYTYANEDLDISFSELMKDADLIEMDKNTKSAYLNSFSTIIKNASFVKSGNEDLLIGNTSKKCKRTTIMLNEFDIKNGLIELIGALENDNRLEQVKKNLESTNQSYLVYEIEEQLRNFKDEIKEYYDVDNITLDIYTRNGQAIQVSMKITPDRDYKDETLTVKLGFLGEKDITDNIRFEFMMGEDEGKIVLTSKSNSSGKKNQITNDIQISTYNYGNETMRLNSSGDIDLSRKKDNLKYNFKMRVEDDFLVDVSIKGDFKTSSKNIEYNLKDVSFVFENPYYNEKIMVEASLFLSSTDGVKNIAKVEERDKIKVLELLEYDIYDITETLQMNMENIFYSLGLY